MRNAYTSKIDAARNSRLQLTRIHTELAMDLRSIADRDEAGRRAMLEAMKREIIDALDAIDALQGWPKVPHHSPHA